MGLGNEVAKFPATSSGSMVKFPRLDIAFSGVFELEPSPGKGQSLHKKIRRGEKEKAQKKIIITIKRKPKDVGYFLFQISIFSDARAKML